MPPTQIIINGETVLSSENFPEEKKKALREIHFLYSKDESIKGRILDLFMYEWNRRGNLRTFREWWENIPKSFSITSVGKVLAHANAQRCDKSLPALN